MGEQRQSDQHPSTDNRSHEMCLSLLAEYAAATALGRPTRDYPAVAAHLAQCATCRAELAQLLDLVEPIYAGTIAASTEAPRVRLDFLNPVGPQTMPDATTLRTGGRQLVVVSSERLVAAARRLALASPARGESLFRYSPAPQPPGNLQIVVEVFVSDEDPQLVTVQVLVDVPDRSPVDQAGVMVALDVGGRQFRGQTEATGVVTFSAVPLVDLAGMRVEVEVPGS